MKTRRDFPRTLIAARNRIPPGSRKKRRVSMWSRLAASRRLHFFVMALAMTLLSFGLHAQNWFGSAFLDSISLDGYFKLRGAIPARDVSENLPETRDIVLVETTHQLPRPLMANLLRQLRQARVVAFDMMFVDDEKLLHPDDLSVEQKQQWYGTSLRYWRHSDALLANAIRENGNVVLGIWPEEKRDRPSVSQVENPTDIAQFATAASGFSALFGDKSSTRFTGNDVVSRSERDEIYLWQQPSPLLWKAARAHAHLLVSPDEKDNVVRTVHLFDGPKNARHPALGLVLAATALGVSRAELMREVAKMNPDGGVLKLGNRGIPYARDGLITIDYAGTRESFDGNRIAYNRVLDTDYSAPEDFKDKIVIIGEASQTSKEILKTPFGLMPGMQIHANIAATLLSPRAALRPVPPIFVVILSLMASMFLLAPLLRFPLWTIFVVSLMEYAISFWLGAGIFANSRLILPLSVPVLTVTLTCASLALYEYGRARNTLGIFIGAEMLPRTLSLFSQLRLGGRIDVATAWFCDLRGYSSLSENMEAQQVSELLEQYTDTLVRCVKKHGGRPIDFQGDGVFVLFEHNPLKIDFSERAVLAAFEVARALGEINENRRETADTPFNFSIGMATGKMMIGVVGSTQNMKMGAVGDAVNVAARVQSLSRQCGFQILLARSTYERVLERFDCVSCGTFEVHGRTKPIDVYGLGRAVPPEPERRKVIAVTTRLYEDESILQ